MKTCAGIAAIIGLVGFLVVLLFAIFSPENLPASAWIVAPLCVMGIALGCLATKGEMLR
ncbi:hypothetical protein [Pelagicoccus sp. SDUM812002]|uniref:hypothetical protein n=1 Tax=Pelagicoccus sp. SDUM812002 TaxID=3041266 RepID=UPI00280CE2EE|nr:hypothetical protein [Pelagicoccus sp. SDUM812002]MDQ8187420.1 hypothetical protein [Pelagicoccus sp. SDUM812002]